MVLKMVEYKTDQMASEDGYVSTAQQDIGQVELPEEDDPF